MGKRVKGNRGKDQSLSPVTLFSSSPLFLPARLAFGTATVTTARDAPTVASETTRATITTATACDSIGPGLGFVTSWVSSTKLLAVKLLDSSCRFFRSRHF